MSPASLLSRSDQVRSRRCAHRCLARHGISRLPAVDGDKPAKKRFKAYPIGYVHIDIAEVQTAEGKLHLHVAIDRTSKFAVVRRATKTGRTSARAFLEPAIEVIPYKIHTVLTDNRWPGAIDPIREAGAAVGRERNPVHVPQALRRRPDRPLHDAHVRHALPRERHRAPSHQAEAPPPRPAGRSTALLSILWRSDQKPAGL